MGCKGSLAARTDKAIEAHLLTSGIFRLIETNIHECLEARTDSLPNLRELGPPDLVELIKQAPGKTQKQVCCMKLLRRGMEADSCTDRFLPPCYRCRCFFVCQFGCLHQYPYIHCL